MLWYINASQGDNIMYLDTMLPKGVYYLDTNPSQFFKKKMKYFLSHWQNVLLPKWPFMKQYQHLGQIFLM